MACTDSNKQWLWVEVDVVYSTSDPARYQSKMAWLRVRKKKVTGSNWSFGRYKDWNRDSLFDKYLKSFDLMST